MHRVEHDEMIVAPQEVLSQANPSRSHVQQLDAGAIPHLGRQGFENPDAEPVIPPQLVPESGDQRAPDDGGIGTRI